MSRLAWRNLSGLPCKRSLAILFQTGADLKCCSRLRRTLGLVKQPHRRDAPHRNVLHPNDNMTLPLPPATPPTIGGLIDQSRLAKRTPVPSHRPSYTTGRSFHPCKAETPLTSSGISFIRSGSAIPGFTVSTAITSVTGMGEGAAYRLWLHLQPSAKYESGKTQQDHLKPPLVCIATDVIADTTISPPCPLLSVTMIK